MRINAGVHVYADGNLRFFTSFFSDCHNLIHFIKMIDVDERSVINGSFQIFFRFIWTIENYLASRNAVCQGFFKFKS